VSVGASAKTKQVLVTPAQLSLMAMAIDIQIHITNLVLLSL